MIPWLGAFVFTQLVECPIYVAALRKSERSWALALAIAFGASAITHPVVWFVIPWLWNALHRAGGYWGMVVAAELFAILVEALYLNRLGLRRALVWAFVANLSSVTLGLISRAIFGWP